MYKIPARTLFLGKNLLILPECPSTNTFALELSQSGQAPEGTVVVTHHQTAGRGQRGNTWQSGKGLNLTMSLVLYPVFLTAIEQFQFNKVISLAVRETVQPYTKELVTVKWPNDILIGNKKTGGILIENQLAGAMVSRSIVGIGLNVNQTEFESPMATSISSHSGKPIDLAKIFEELLQSVEWRYFQLKRRQIPEIDDDYLKVLFGFNESRRFIVNDLEVTGVIRNVDVNGRLVVEIGGSTRAFDLKEIKYLY